MLDPYDPFAALTEPQKPVYTQSERYKKLVGKGLTLGLGNRDVQAESLLEHGAQIAGSLPTYAAAGAATGPFIAPLLGRLGIAATPLIARTVGAGLVGAGGGAIEGATGEQGALAGAATGGLMGAGGELGMIGAGKLGGAVLSKLRGKTPDAIVQEITRAETVPTSKALATIKRPTVEAEEGAPLVPSTDPGFRFGTPESKPRPGERVRARVVQDFSEGGAANITPYEGAQAPAPEAPAPAPVSKYNKTLDPADPDTKIYQANLEAGRMPWETASPKEQTRLYRKYKKLPEGEAPPSPAKSAEINDAIVRSDAPSPAMVDTTTSIVPDLPPAPPVSPLRALTPYVPPAPPETPVIKIATAGPNLSRTVDEAVVNADRLPLDHFIARPPEPTAFFQPPPSINDSAIRSAWENRYTSEVIRTAENMEFPEFQKYAAQNAIVARVISESRATPETVWRAAQLVKDIPTNAIPTRFSSVGKTPMFSEAFDDTLGKKVLVPIDAHADAVVEHLKSLPYPRVNEIQFEPEQVKFLQSPEGQALLRQYDVHTNNEPFLTSNLLNKPAEEVENIVNNMKPLDIIKPAIIKPSEGGKRAINLRKKMGISSPELEGMKDAIKERVPPAKQKETLTDSILKRCE